MLQDLALKSPPQVAESLLILRTQPALLAFQQGQLLEVVAARQIQVLDL